MKQSCANDQSTFIRSFFASPFLSKFWTCDGWHSTNTITLNYLQTLSEWDIYSSYLRRWLLATSNRPRRRRTSLSFPCISPASPYGVAFPGPPTSLRATGVLQAYYVHATHVLRACYGRATGPHAWASKKSKKRSFGSLLGTMRQQPPHHKLMAFISGIRRPFSPYKRGCLSKCMHSSRR